MLQILSFRDGPSGRARNPYVDGPRLARPAARMTVLVDCGHMSGLCVRRGWPLAQMGYADRVPNMKMVSEHHWVPRVVPILGPTDRHLAVVLASARAVWPVCGLMPPVAGGRVRRAPAWPR